MINLFLSSALPFVVSLIILYIFSKALSKRSVRVLGFKGSILLLWVGTTIHELSHLLGCFLTLTKVEKIAFFKPEKQEDGSYRLGYVSHVSPKNPLSSMIIGLMPLVGGALVLWFSSKWLIPEAHLVVLNVNDITSWYQGIIYGFLKSGEALWNVVLSIDFSHWQTYLFFYLSFSIGAHLSPSGQDFKNARTGLITLGIIIVALYILNIFYGFLGVLIGVAGVYAGEYIIALTSVMQFATLLIIVCIIICEIIYWLRNKLFYKKPIDPNWFAS